MEFLIILAIYVVLFLAAPALAFLVWKKTRSPVMCLAALIAALMLPNLRWLATQATFKLKEREIHHEILERVERPESLFIQNDLGGDALHIEVGDGDPDENNPYR